MSERTEEADEKPVYVAALEAAYGEPSQEGFGSAVFFDQMQQDDDLEEVAKKYYQYFVGKNWDEWGEDVWMSPWKEGFRRPQKRKHNIEEELRAIEDFNTQLQVGMILDDIENAEAAKAALAGAYDPKVVIDLRAYNIGDGEAMSGLLLAGLRDNGEATFLVFLMD